MNKSTRQHRSKQTERKARIEIPSRDLRAMEYQEEADHSDGTAREEKIKKASELARTPERNKEASGKTKERA